MNQGCASGRSDVALQYANEQAISCQSNYPYKQTRGSCAVRSGPPPYKVNYEQIKVANEEELECLVRKGPVIAYIYVCPRLQMYKSGIFNDATCYGKVNQAVLIVGMGQTTDGVEY
jgi:hypothetical protein